MEKNTLNITKNIIQQYGIHATKRFGQNFLIDDFVLQSIVQAANITEDTLVIEIGPGLGNLTAYLLEASPYCILVEIDKKIIQILQERFSNQNNFILLNEDILKINLDEIIRQVEEKQNMKFAHVKVVANLPYYITTPILFQLLQHTKRVEEIIVMVQKEVAKRMVSKPRTKDYGILTLMVEYLCDCEIAMEVPSQSFIPAPSVTSAVVRLVKNKKYPLSEEQEKIFFELIHKSFAQRRKKIINSLYSTSFMNKSKEELGRIITECHLDINVRAEEINLQKYLEILAQL